MASKTYKPLGIAVDIDPAELDDDQWSRGQNIIFGSEKGSRVQGLQRVFDPPLFQPKHLLQTGGSQESAEYLNIYMSDANIGVVSQGTHTDITPVAGILASNQDNEWTSGKLNGIPFMNNGEGDPLFWDEVLLNPAQTLPDWPTGFKCRSMRAFKYHLFALGVIDGIDVLNDLYMWSDAANPGAIPQSWTAGPTTEAGDDTLSETKGDILDAVPLRDSLIIYKDTSCYIVNYVAGNSVFANRLLFSQIGLLARNCCVEVYGEHYCFTPGDLIKHDGHTVTSIADNLIRDFIFLDIDPENFGNAYVVWDPQNKAVWFCWPRSGERFPGAAAIYDIVSGKWGVRILHREASHCATLIIDEAETGIWDDDNQAWDEDATAWNEVQFSEAVEKVMQANYIDTRLYAVDVGNTFDGELIESALAKHTMSLDDEGAIKTVNRIWPRITGQGNIEVRLGRQEHPDEAIEWGEYKPFIVGQDKVDYFMTGRYISLEYRSVEQQQWHTTGFRLEYEIRGKF